jgi:hypothetical protein
VPSDDSTTPRRARRSASSRQPAAAPQLHTTPAARLWAAMDGIFSVPIGGMIFLGLSAKDAVELCDAVDAVLNDPTADERYGERAMTQLTNLAEALSDALAGTPLGQSVPEIHPEE